jgi:hypothetical protein
VLVRDEPAAPDELVEVIAEARRQIEAEHTPPRLKRDAHPKMHGCVQATLEVNPKIDDNFAHGVFARRDDAAPYKAWVRFSNAFSIQHDLEIETRGMAVKLLGVTDGTPLPEAEVVSTAEARTFYRKEVVSTGEGATFYSEEVVSVAESKPFYTQDFLFATHDAFFLPDPSEYLDFLKRVRTASAGVAAFYRDRWPRLWRGFLALIVSQLKGATFNPLSLTYFSQTPYHLGPEVVKLRMRPVDPPSLRWYKYPAFWLTLLLANGVFFVLEPMTKRGKAWAETFCDGHFASRDLLRFAMMRTLAVREVTFVLEVQRWDGVTDLNNACLRWKGKFEPVATLRIPSQTFWPQAGFPASMNDAMKTLVSLGENMSFNPWHGLTDHTPLGSINDARRWIYRDIARFRRDANHIDAASMPRVQRTAWDDLRPFIQP